MEIKKAIKRITALGVGSAMVGATIMGAMAADLNDWPAPFITRDSTGKPVFDAWLVVGDTAAPADIIGITDIAISLQFQFTEAGGSGSGSGVSVSGDAWQIGTVADRLELGEAFDQALSRVGKDELGALADGVVNNQKGNADYEQFLRLDDGNATFEEDTDSDLVADYVKYKNDEHFFNYSLEFQTNFESDVTDSAGDSSATGTFFLDFEDEDLTILGKSYTVLTARRTSSTSDGIKLTLLGGDLTDTLQEGEVKTYSLAGNEYEVENAIVTDSGTIYTQLKINGVLTKKLQEDQTETLPDGIVVGIKDILPNEAGDVTGDLVRFTLGADKLFLQDTDVTNSAADSSKVEINDETANDAEVIIKGSNDNSTFAISSILLNVKSDDDIWVSAGSRLSDNAELDEDTARFLRAFSIDIQYEGLTEEKTSEIKVSSSGDDQYNLIFSNRAGNVIKVPIAFDPTSSTDTVLLPATSDSSNNFTLHPLATGIAKNEYFMVTDKTNNEDGYTEVLQYKGADKLSDSSPQIKFKALGSGETLQKSLSTVSGNAQATFTVGGSEYTVQNTSDGGTSATADDFRINITGSPSGASFNQAVSKHGALITLNTNFTDTTDGTNQTGGGGGGGNYYLLSGINITLTNPSSQYDSAPSTTPDGDLVSYAFSASGSDDLLSMTRALGIVTYTTDFDTNVRHGMSQYGTWIEFISESSKPHELTVKVPANQRLPQVFLTSGATSSAASSSGSGGSSVIHRINVGATRLASQVSNVGAQNMIVVGGPSVNAVASELQGNPTREQINELYQEGKALIRMFESGENVAMLVAGYSAVDTTRATVVVAKDGGSQLKGLANGVSEVSVNTINPTPVVEVASS